MPNCLRDTDRHRHYGMRLRSSEPRRRSIVRRMRTLDRTCRSPVKVQHSGVIGRFMKSGTSCGVHRVCCSTRYGAFTRVVCALCIAVVSVGCGDADTQISVKYASDYAQPRAGISVFGVFENGRMSTESWKDIGSELSSSFIGGSCEAAWGNGLFNSDFALASAVDEYTMDEGVSDELLGEVAKIAEGDAILTITVLGRRMPKGSEGGAKRVRVKSSSPVSIGGGRGMRGSRGLARRTAPSERDSADSGRSYQISASLFSTRLRHTMAVVAVSYSGPDTEVALHQFEDKLRASFPNVVCKGWNRDGRVDVERVRALLTQGATNPAD